MTDRDIETRLDEIARTLNRVEVTTRALEVTVRGSSDYGSRGLMPQLDKLEKRVHRLETLANRLLWMAAGMGLAGSVAGDVIRALISG